jgi:hypothetical protein
VKIKNVRLELILVIGFVSALSLSGMWMLRAATPFGLGLNTDSVYYVNGARNIQAGDGFTRTSGEGILKPITHFPPLFSLVLAFVGLGGLDPLRGGRLVIILLYGANSLLFAWLVWKLTRRSWLTVVGAFLMVFSSVNLRASSWLMSEPLYLFLMLISFLVAYSYMKNWKPATILGLGVLSGLTYLTRYVGLSLVITWLAVILLFLPGWRRKAAHASLFLLGSLPFVIGIMLRNYRLTGSTGNRNFILHLAPFEKIADGIRAFWGWILPSGSHAYYDSLSWVFIIIFFALLSAGSVFLIQSLIRSLRTRVLAMPAGLLLVLALHVTIYLAGVLVAMNFFDATTVLDDRMLLPVFWILLLFILVGMDHLWKAKKSRNQSLWAGALVVVMGVVIYGSINTVGELKQDGQGFIDRYRRESQTMQYIRENDIGLFYTNTPPPVYILTGKAGYTVPTPYDSLTLQTRESYQADLATMKEKIIAQDGFLIFFFEIGFETDPWYLELTAGLEPKVRTTDGIIWGRVE